MQRDFWAVYDLSMSWWDLPPARREPPTATVAFWVVAGLAHLPVELFLLKALD